jgi:hypothetical protein
VFSTRQWRAYFWRTETRRKFQTGNDIGSQVPQVYPMPGHTDWLAVVLRLWVGLESHESAVNSWKIADLWDVRPAEEWEAKQRHCIPTSSLARELQPKISTSDDRSHRTRKPTILHCWMPLPSNVTENTSLCIILFSEMQPRAVQSSDKYDYQTPSLVN